MSHCIGSIPETRISTMQTPSIIYLDRGFIIELYEELKCTKVPVSITKKLNFSGELSAGFAKGGTSVEETKEFSISTRKMYNELGEHLDAIPIIDLDKTEDAELPELFWADGIFCGGHSTLRQGDERIASADLFRLQTSIGTVKRWISLTTCDSYFVSGYDQLPKYGYALTVGFGIRAKVLVRLLYLDQHCPVGAAMVIIKQNNMHAE
jgi:hypothetical protein